ncbi:25720_t:CDS:2, partial [Gigaspora rosea]
LEMEEGHIDQDLNIEIDDESDEQSNNKLLELFEGHVEKDKNNQEISRLFLCHHAGKPPTQKNHIIQRNLDHIILT